MGQMMTSKDMYLVTKNKGFFVKVTKFKIAKVAKLELSLAKISVFPVSRTGLLVTVVKKTTIMIYFHHSLIFQLSFKGIDAQNLTSKAF